MPRKKVEIDIKELQGMMMFAEATGLYKSENDLWNIIAATDWAIKNGFSASKIRKTAKEHKLKFLTKTQNTDPPHTKKAKSVSDEQVQKVAKQLDNIPVRGKKNLLKQYKKGSRKAAMHIFCLTCAGSMIGVQECKITQCPLHPLRPYKE